MFADPQTITINAVAKSLIRINQDKYASEYLLREATQEFRMKIRNTSYSPDGGVTQIHRHNVEFVQTIYATLPAKPIVRKIYSVLEHGSSDVGVDPVKTFAGHVGFLTEANITKLMNFES